MRRKHDRASLEAEAAVMEFARRAGYPVPRVHELRSDGRELVMERIEGPSMLDELRSKPWRIRRLARTLVELHRQLDGLPAPPDIAGVGGGGGCLVHLDLHPENVIMSTRGPFVVDWSNAAAGPRDLDVATTWVILATSDIPRSGVQMLAVRTGRGMFLRTFVAHSDVDQTGAFLPAALSRRIGDPNLTTPERAAVEAWLARCQLDGGNP